MKRALGYCRISISDEKSVSLSYQRAEIEKYCRTNNLLLIAVEEDDGISGASMANRPGLMRVLEAIKGRLIDALVVFRSDRVSRNGRESLAFEELMNDQGVEYLSITEGKLSADTPDDVLMQFLRAALGERERRLIGLRTRQAMARKKEKNEFMGRPPYGFKAQDGRLVADLEEQKTISRVRALRQKGYTVQQILEDLRLAGIRTRRGTDFCRNQINRILMKVA